MHSSKVWPSCSGLTQPAVASGVFPDKPPTLPHWRREGRGSYGETHWSGSKASLLLTAHWSGCPHLPGSELHMAGSVPSFLRRYKGRGWRPE